MKKVLIHVCCSSAKAYLAICANLLSLNLLSNEMWLRQVRSHDSSSMSTQVLNRCNGFSFSLIVRVRLGRCCIELHYGNIFEDAIASIIGCFEVAQRTGSK